jgi:taurine dioxygenase
MSRAGDEIAREHSELDVDVTPLSGTFGAEVRGLDLLATCRDDDGLRCVRALLAAHLVVAFPGQNLDEHGLLAAASRLGTPLEWRESHRFRDPNFPAVRKIEGPIDGRFGVADKWHVDGSYKRVPEAFVVLQMMQRPGRGGDTAWSNHCAAFDALSDPMKEFARSLTGIHEENPSDPADERRCEQPLVCVHPGNGCEFLYVTSGFLTRIPQLRPRESAMLLEHLRSFIAQPEFTLRRSHEVGDIVVWDNRCTSHYAVHDYTETRRVWRVAVADDGPLQASQPDRLAPHYDIERIVARTM